MEHGAAGEARTKAFLLDRFWVLERSVDIDGADFLIQLRSLNNRFTDSAPPRVGIVQAKYYQNKSTTQHIPCRYVIDEKGQPLKGFFAVLNVGREDDSEMYLLSASDIVETLSKNSSDPASYIAGTKAFSEKFKIINRGQALDKIQHALTRRSTVDSLRFLDQVNIPYYKVEKDAIEFDYTLPVPNTRVDIAKTFYESKSDLRTILYDMEEALVALDNIFKATSPQVALGELEKIQKFRIKQNSGWYDGLAFTVHKCDLEWWDLSEAIKEHDETLGALDELGIRAKFLDLSVRVKAEIFDKVSGFYNEAQSDQQYCAVVDIDVDTLTVGNVRLTLIDKVERAPEGDFTWHVSVGGQHPRIPKRAIAEVSDELWNIVMWKLLVCLGVLRDEKDDL